MYGSVCLHLHEPTTYTNLWSWKIASTHLHWYIENLLWHIVVFSKHWLEFYTEQTGIYTKFPSLVLWHASEAIETHLKDRVSEILCPIVKWAAATWLSGKLRYSPSLCLSRQVNDLQKTVRNIATISIQFLPWCLNKIFGQTKQYKHLHKITKHIHLGYGWQADRVNLPLTTHQHTVIEFFLVGWKYAAQHLLPE